mmetsp:Transcript_28210/g.71608  ORF Transcript_28210/g.71608 Transcript_28210/m.71608 type:complete len:234 (-) Transcript_28210:143-844(-)
MLPYWERLFLVHFRPPRILSRRPLLRLFGCHLDLAHALLAPLLSPPFRSRRSSPQRAPLPAETRIPAPRGRISPFPKTVPALSSAFPSALFRPAQSFPSISRRSSRSTPPSASPRRLCKPAAASRATHRAAEATRPPIYQRSREGPGGGLAAQPRPEEKQTAAAEAGLPEVADLRANRPRDSRRAAGASESAAARSSCWFRSNLLDHAGLKPCRVLRLVSRDVWLLRLSHATL